MSQDNPQTTPPPSPLPETERGSQTTSPPLRLGEGVGGGVVSPTLEKVTAAVLLLVVGSLGWILLAAASPEWADGAAGRIQVGIVLSLLTAALVLVSVVALLHTR